MESSVKEGGQAECGAGVLGKQGIAAQDMGSGLKQHTSLCADRALCTLPPGHHPIHAMRPCH